MDDTQRSTSGGHAVLQMAPLAGLTAPMVVASAEGIRLRDSHGHEYVDALSGLVNVNVGYGREELVEAASAALRRLSYGTNFFGRTTQEMLDLADKLAEIAPAPLERFFFSTGGSDAVDTAIKLVRHGNVLAGKPEKMIVIARRNGYHGMTFGGTTATGQDVLRERVGPLLPGVIHVEQPDPSDGAASARELEQAILREGPDNVAAFIGEPIALPPGVAIPPDDYWPAVREVCTRHDVRLIVDEVVTGFGRTGRMFASEHWDLEPDLMTMSKGLTSGYQPLGAVGLRGELFEMLTTSETLLPHGFTAGGHPVACAVALANIEIIEREGLVEQAAEVGRHLLGGLERLAADHEGIMRVRGLGMLAAFDLDGERLADEPGAAAQAGARLAETLLDDGVIVRPYANTIAFGPPLISTAEDVDGILERFDSALNQLERTPVGA